MKQNGVIEIKYMNIGLFFSVISIFASFYSYTTYGPYKYLFVLPIAFAIFNILFIEIYNKMSIQEFIVLLFMLIRYAITPIIVRLENYPIDLYFFVNDKNVSIYSIVIMAFEMLMIFIALITNKNKNIDINENISEQIISKTNFDQINSIILCLLLFTIALILAFPSVLSNYSFVFSESLDSLSVDSTKQLDNLPMGVGFISNMLIEMCRFLVIQKVVLWSYKKYEYNENLIYFILPIVLISLNAIVISSRMLIGLLMSFVFLYEVYILFDKYKKKMIYVGLTFGVVFFCLFVLSYFNNSLSYRSFSCLLQDYTNGYYGVYQSQMAYKRFNLSIVDKFYTFILGDCFSKVAVISSLYSYRIDSTRIYNYYLYNTLFNGGKIVPLISEISYFFSPIFGPSVSYFCIKMMQKFSNKVYMCKGNVCLNMYISIIFAMTPFMYNLGVLIHLLTTVVLPLAITVFINSRVVIKTHD